MKKSDFILIGAFLVLIVVGILSSKGTEKLPEIEFPLKLSGEVGLHEITYSEYDDMVKNGDAFVVVIERTTCGYCQQYMPIMEEVAKEQKIAVTYINTDNITQEELNELSTKNKYLKKNQWGTPTTLFMLGDRIVDSISGYVGKESIEAFFKDRVVVGE
jgi:predicted bacteriocin transport accessory protein